MQTLQLTPLNFPRYFSEYTSTPVEDIIPDLSEEILQILKTTTSLNELVTQWLSSAGERGVVFQSDSDEAVKIIFLQNSKEVYYFFLNNQEIQATYLDVPNLQDYLENTGSKDRISLREEAYEKAIGINFEKFWDDEFCILRVPLSESMRSILSYAISGRGRGAIECLADDLDLLYSDDGEELDRSKTFGLELSYQTDTSLRTIGESFFL